jgi:hypothetical protein
MATEKPTEFLEQMRDTGQLLCIPDYEEDAFSGAEWPKPSRVGDEELRRFLERTGQVAYVPEFDGGYGAKPSSNMNPGRS